MHKFGTCIHLSQHFLFSLQSMQYVFVSTVYAVFNMTKSFPYALKLLICWFAVLNTIYSECARSMKEAMYSVFPPKFPKSFKHLETYMQAIWMLLMTACVSELSTYFKSNLMSYIMGNTSFIT